MVVDVRNFNLICDFTESGESGFSTTYCGYPKYHSVATIKGEKTLEEVLGKFTAQRIDNGEVIEGNLVCGENSPFVYILTEENFKRMIVDDEGNCKCTLIRVMKKSLKIQGVSI